MNMPTTSIKQPLPPLKPGDKVIDGKYEIIELTSNPGGFGRIYRAYGNEKNNDGSRHISAIKEFYVSEFGCNPRFSSMQSYTICETRTKLDILRTKFYEEVRTLSILYRQNDNHQPKIEEPVWNGPNGRLLYAMNFVEGSTLRELMENHEKGYTMSEKEAVGYIVQIGKVLHKAHTNGLVHADVSPNNIMVKKDHDYAVLVDWGNSKSYNEDLAISCLHNANGNDIVSRCKADLDSKIRSFCSRYGVVSYERPRIETIGYTAPSSFWGKPQSDVYSLAATLFYLLTGSHHTDARRFIRFRRELKYGISVSDICAEKDYQLLKEHKVSPTTICAIQHALNDNLEQTTQSIQDFLAELPQDIVISTLLKYQDQ